MFNDHPMRFVITITTDDAPGHIPVWAGKSEQDALFHVNNTQRWAEGEIFLWEWREGRYTEV